MNIEMIDNTGETLHGAGGVPELLQAVASLASMNGYHAALHAGKELKEFGRYRDEEGEPTDAILDFLAAVRRVALLANAVCPECKGSGQRDSGGVQPWGEAIMLQCDCALAALAARPLSGGWVSVPVEPTEAMLIAGAYINEPNAWVLVRKVYAAMLAAALPAGTDEGGR